ncbi:MAG: sodium:solute symporter family protein [Cytophagales bacterium]|nr:sodium:solute symporter family protein [Cytophagales bacterium]MDW8383815.1 sodium:solute symporter family protein [Flammeovirgaceae bacterium]
MLIAGILLYLLLTLGVGILASRKVNSSQDFVLAGRSLPLGLSVAAVFATWFGSETILGASARFNENGLKGLIEEPLGAALCLVLTGRFFVRPLYQLNLLTLGDFFRYTYGKRVELIACLLMVPSFVGWIAAQLVALGIIFQMTLHVSIEEGIWIGAIVVLIYTFFGGMWAISLTDFIQSITIIVGLLYIFYSFLQQTEWKTILQNTSSQYWDILPSGDTISIAEYFAAWIVIGLGSIPSQDIFQRAMSAKDVQTSQRSFYIGAALYLVIAFLPALICLIAKSQFQIDFHENNIQTILPAIILQRTHVIVQIFFFGALLSAIMSTTSSAILAPASILAENIIKPNFLKSATDKQLLITLRISVVVMTIWSILWAQYFQNITELVAESSAESLVSLFVPLVAGIYFKRKTQLSAILSMIVGMLVYIIALIGETKIPALLWGFFASWLAFIIGNCSIFGK